MRIIKRGENPSEKPRRAKCHHCKTEVEFYPSEVNSANDRNEEVSWIECPVCQKWIYV